MKRQSTEDLSAVKISCVIPQLWIHVVHTFAQTPGMNPNVSVDFGR